MRPAFAIVFITKNIYTADNILIKLYKASVAKPVLRKNILCHIF